MPSFCEHCGNPVNDEANFCAYCGHRLERDLTPEAFEMTEPTHSVRKNPRRDFDPRRILAWLKGSDTEEIYAEEPGEYEEYEEVDEYEDEFGQPEPDPEEETFGFEDTMGTDAYIQKWDRVLEVEDAYIDDDEDFSIYDQHNNFLKKVAIICVTIIALVAGGFMLISAMAGEREDEVPGPDQAALEELKAAAFHFFLDVKELDEEELATYEGIDYSRYSAEDSQMEEDLSMFLFYTRYSEMIIQEVEAAVIEGDIGLVQFQMDGPEDALAIFQESLFRNVEGQWQYDFGSFIRKLRGDAGLPVEEEPAGPDDPEPVRDLEADEIAITRRAQDFNTAWHNYVNTGNEAARSHLLPGSSAVERFNSISISGISHERQNLQLSNVSVRDERGSIQVYEKFRRTENGTVTLVEYTWRYDLTLSEGQWLIDHYTRLSSNVQEIKPEDSTQDPEPQEGEPVVIPDGFTADGTITGGTESTDNEVKEMRYSSENHRLVLDLFKDGTQADSPVRFELRRTETGVILTLWGVDKFSASVPDLGSGQPAVSFEKPVKTTEGYRMNIVLRDGAAYNAFGLNKAEGRPARIVIDFVQT